jgi:hypothetical protein
VSYSNEILLKSPLSAFKLGFYDEHGTWDLISTSSTDVVSKGMSSIKLLTTICCNWPTILDKLALFPFCL